MVLIATYGSMHTSTNIINLYTCELQEAIPKRAGFKSPVLQVSVKQMKITKIIVFLFFS